MALLSDTIRQEIRDIWMRVNEENVSIVKDDLRAAVNALDQWLSDNDAAANTAIPEPARTALTKAQKARILVLLIERRFIDGV